MLYQYYNAVKTILEALTDIKAVEWFNNQYEGTIHQDKVVWIEFPDPILINPDTKSMERAELKIRLHVVSRVIQRTDNTIPDAEIVSHETMATNVLQAMRNQQLINDSDNYITTRLRWSGWQHWHKYEGWMVTWIEFTCRTALL